MGAHVPGFQKGGHGKTLRAGIAPFHGTDGPVLPGVGIQPDRRASGKKEALAELRDRDEIGRNERGRRTGGETGHPQVGVIVNPPSAVGIEHVREVGEIHGGMFTLKPPGSQRILVDLPRRCYYDF